MSVGTSDVRAGINGGGATIEVRVGATIRIAFPSPGRALLKMIPAASDSQAIDVEHIVIAGAAHRVELLGEDRVVVIDADAPRDVTVTYGGVTRVRRAPALPRIVPDAHYTHLMHGRWLIPSRYCPSDRLAPTAEALFPDRLDPRLLEHCREWVLGNVTYVPGSSDGMTSADETLLRREGICRDFAHLLIALLRGLGIPSRFVAAYGPGVDPPDFHAVVEAHDGQAWQLLDPTGMTTPAELVVIARGRDAADVPWCQIQGGPADVAPPQVSAFIEPDRLRAARQKPAFADATKCSVSESARPENSTSS